MSAPTATPASQSQEPGAPKTASARPSRAPTAQREERAGWILTLPFLALFLVFTAWPVIQSVFFSFTDMRNRDLRTPFGGRGQSGLGSEGGFEAMRFFTEPKNVGIAL